VAASAGEATPSLVRYRVLGPVQLCDADGPVRLGSEQQRVLLAQLLVDAGRPVAADRLADELWGAELPTEPRVALRTQVSRLRRRLAPDALVTEDQGYRLRVGESELDAALYEDLVARADVAPAGAAVALLDDALALWRGAAYADFAHRDFARPDAIRLDELRVAARVRRGELLVDLEREGEAIADLEALLADDPEREGVRALLMRTLYRAGRHTDALRTYQEWRAFLADELGVEPSPELRALEQQILDHDVAPARVRTEVIAPPQPVTSFVGRREELQVVDSALSEHRLVALVGPGGVGKTRLAIEAARRVAARYPHGVVFCDLSTVARGADVVHVVANALGVEERAARSLEAQLAAHLRTRRCLLLVDNCEHVVSATARLLSRLVQHTTAVDVLATSREPLAVAGERRIAVEPLATEGADSVAAALFADRARSVDAAFTTSGDIGSVQTICRRLDGLPLAIELAAARVRSLSLVELAAGLEQRFDLLTGARDEDERHQSLHSAIDWSYALLSPEEQAVFARLSVFASWFDLDAARGVAGDIVGQERVVAVLTRLVDCSLVVARRVGDRSQYSLLDSMRSSGVATLAASGDLDGARDRHAAWVVHLAQEVAARLAGPEEGEWADTITRHFAEARAAHEWLVGRDVERAMQLVAALRPYALWRRNTEIGAWADVTASVAAGEPHPLLPAVLLSAFVGAWQRGDYGIAAELAAVAAQAVLPADAATVLYVADAVADVAFFAGDVASAARLHRAAAELAIEAGDLLQAMWTLGSVSHALMYGGELEAAHPVAEETAALAARCGGPTAFAMSEWVFGELYAATDLERARAHLERAIVLATSVGSRQIVTEAEYGLAIVKARLGDLAGALQHFETLLVDADETRTAILPRDLVRIVEVLVLAGSYDDAARLTGAATSMRRSARRFPVAEAALLQASARIQAELGDEGLAQRSAEGVELDEAQTVAVARRAIEQVTRK
jgi:predicted ATPase/DNA-binding SARP family transcriptional activator